MSRFRGSPERDTDGTLFFAAFDPKHGEELWKSDGTEAGTVLVKDINPGPASSSPGGFANIGGTVFFSALDPLVGDELWKTDGTPEGTVLVADISPGPGSSCSSAGSSCPGRLINVNGTLFFFAKEPAHGDELWKSDGTAAGTVLVKGHQPRPRRL